MDTKRSSLLVITTPGGAIISAMDYDPENARDATPWMDEKLTGVRRLQQYFDLPLDVSWQNGKGKRRKRFGDFSSAAAHLNEHVGADRHHDFEIRLVPRRKSRAAKPPATKRQARQRFAEVK